MPPSESHALGPQSDRRQRVMAWLLLLGASLVLYSPYCTTRFVSGNGDRDAQTYLAVLADAREQARHGFFPPYVGQSALRPNGGLYPQAQAPGFTWLGVMLDVATGRRLETTTLMNLLVLSSALGGAAAMQLCLLGLLPDGTRRRGDALGAAALALAYVACPGVLGIVMRLDMLMSFLALPFLPWAWWGLGKLSMGHVRRGGAALGLSLAALWSVHAPVALWASSAALIALVVTALSGRRWPWRGVAWAALVGAAAAAWTFTGAFVLAGGRAGNVGLGGGWWLSPGFVEQVLTSVRGDFPAAWLPVGWVRGHPFNGWPGAGTIRLPRAWRETAVLPYLQLGWVLWSAWAVAGVWYLRRVRAAWPRPLDGLAAAGAGLWAAGAWLAGCVVPVPGLTAALWRALPSFFEITKWWPAQRLYLVLASLAAPAAWLAWRAGRPGPRARRTLVVLACLGGAWVLHEGARFTMLGFGFRREPAWIGRPENLVLGRKDMQMSAPRLLPEYGEPAWHLRVVDAQGAVWADNLAAVAALCSHGRPLVSAADDPTRAPVDGSAGHPLVLCVARGSARVPAALRAEASGERAYRYLRLPAPETPGAQWDVLALPPGRHWQVRLLDAQLRPLSLTSGAGADTAPGLRLASYDPGALPIRVTAWLPFRAQLDAPRAGLFLETARSLVPGYRAQVNGRPAEVRALAAGAPLAVALAAGANQVELRYQAPRVLRLAGGCSLAAWVLGLWLVGRRRPEQDRVE